MFAVFAAVKRGWGGGAVVEDGGGNAWSRGVRLRVNRGNRWSLVKEFLKAFFSFPVIVAATVFLALAWLPCAVFDWVKRRIKEGI